MQQFRPDIKPPMWGPHSAVQFAVIENAHKLLNAEPVACLPFWERGFRTQIFDVFGNTVSATGTAHTWDDVGYLTGTNSGEGVLVSLRSGVPNTAFSVFVATRRNTHTSFRDFLSVGVDTTWKNSISTAGTSGNLISFGNGTGYAGNTAEITAGPDLGIGLVLDRAASSRRMYANGSLVSVSYTPSAENFNRIRLNNRVWDDSRNILTSLKFACAFSSVLSRASCDRLYYEPYTLLMPVARPLYFDLGSVAPSVEGPAVITADSTIAASGSKQATSPATVTASASVGMGGVKGSVAPLNIVGTLNVEASGIKSTSSPATITAASAYGASGIKTIIGLDKEGPAVITASSTVGMGGVKGGVGVAIILSNLNYSLTGTKNVVAPCHLTVESIISVDGIKQAIIGCNITAEFILFARKGLDFYPTPRISIESSVTRKIILGSTVTKSIAKAVSIGVNVNIK